MQVNVLLFASYADALGGSRVALEVPDQATLGEIVDRLRACDGGAVLPQRPLVALNRRHARLDQVVTEADEVALIPPVAGG